jgi:hypothetical protein
MNSRTSLIAYGAITMSICLALILGLALFAQASEVTGTLSSGSGSPPPTSVGGGGGGGNGPVSGTSISFPSGGGISQNGSSGGTTFYTSPASSGTTNSSGLVAVTVENNGPVTTDAPSTTPRKNVVKSVAKVQPSTPVRSVSSTAISEQGSEALANPFPEPAEILAQTADPATSARPSEIPVQQASVMSSLADGDIATWSWVLLILAFFVAVTSYALRTDTNQYSRFN